MVATPSVVGPEWQEVLGELKWEGLVAAYGPSAELAVVYTDHPDDLPLVRRAGRTVAVFPTEEGWRRIESASMSAVRLELGSS